ncbi:MAG: septum formation initiator family protein [Alicyclobacillus sp.]|nr:septum formation initiator family protein [Alicyclobacillus sp.]
MSKTAAQSTPSQRSSVERARAVATRRKPRIRIRYLVVALVLLWAGYHYWVQVRPEAVALQSKEAALTKQLAALRAQHQQLQVQAKRLQDKNYVLTYAAEHYNIVLPGQVPFVLAQH